MPSNSGLFKRGGKWWIRYSKDGIQYRESAKTSRKEEAEALLKKRSTEIFEGEFFPAKRATRKTLGELRDIWLLAAKHKASYRDDETRFETVVALLGEQTRIDRLSAEAIDRMRDALLERKTPRGTLMQPPTVNRHLALLRSALNLAVRRSLLRQNPIDGVKFLDEANHRTRMCSDAEYERLLGGAKDPELRLAIQFAYWTGMRLGEVLGLDRSKLNLATGVLHLSAKDTKEGAAKCVPLPAEIVEAIRKHPARIGGKIFGRRVSSISAAFGRLADAVGCGDLRYHDLRRTAATNLRRAGVDVFTIRQITGHKTIETLERYNTIDPADLVRAVSQVVESQRTRENRREMSTV